MATIFALAKLAESRDDTTGAHLERVQSFCRLLSENLALQPYYNVRIDPVFIENIYRASPLHDIGKVGIPDSILLKPGKLTPDEFATMKTHAQIGADIMSGGSSELFTVAAVVEETPPWSYQRSPPCVS